MLFFTLKKRKTAGVSQLFVFEGKPSNDLLRVFNMLCEKSQFNSAVGSDGLSSGEISELRKSSGGMRFLPAKINPDFAALRRELKSLPRPVISADQITPRQNCRRFADQTNRRRKSLPIFHPNFTNGCKCA